MPKKKECVKVATRIPRFRQDTPFMRAHETMVDFIKGNVTNSVMDFLGTGIFGFLQNLELNEERDIYYSDDDVDDIDQQIETQKLKPHPQIKELTDKESDQQITESVDEEEKRKSRTVKNKRKKMRKREKKRQEKEEGDKKALPEDEQEKLSSTESDEEIYNSYTELEKSTTDLLNKPHNLENNIKVIKEEKSLPFNKETEDPPKVCENFYEYENEFQPVSKKKTKTKSEKVEKTQTAQSKQAEKVKETHKQETNKEEKNPKAEKEKVDEIQKEEKVDEIQKEEKVDESKKETVEPIVDEYAKKSREMAAIGNRLAANGQYEMAIKCFTEAIKFTPKEYKIFGNRSFCFERMQQFEEALSDAEVSLALQPNWTKGLFRKGKALCGLKKYYEASLTFTEVLMVESTSEEAIKELKRAQTLHLMEMGFTFAQCTNALKSHSTLEEAADALFTEELDSSLQENGACKSDQATADYSSVDEEWKKIRLSTKPKQSKAKVEPLFLPSKKQAKPGQLFPVWVGSLASTINYGTLHEVFNRVGKVFSIKMVLEHQCAFVNYCTKTDCERAVQLIDGMVLEGRPLAVRYPSRLPPGLGASKHALVDPRTPPCLSKSRECFFWRTIGCTKDDCIYKHVPENKGIDQEKFSLKSSQY